MQLTSTTDYAIRIVCYLAAQRQMISTSELSQELSVPSSYIPKITILLSLQNTYNNKLESVKVSDVIRPGEDEYFGRFYVVLKLNLKEKSYECVYSHIREVYEKVRKTESYELTDEEMNVVKQHPLVGAAMTQRFPEGITTKKLNKYSYEICRHHHERYDGSGYPDGLKGNAIPMCAQVVGIVDAYDALINDRPYKRKYEPEEAIRMISNGECGAFSTKMIQCLTAAVIQLEWLKVTKS